MICLSSCIKYNAPKHFEVLRGKTSICVPVLTAGFVLAPILTPILTPILVIFCTLLRTVTTQSQKK